MSGSGTTPWPPVREEDALRTYEPRAGLRRLPSRLVVNLYLVLGIALLIANSSLDLDTFPRYMLGIALLVVLALVALLCMRLERLDVRATARFYPVEKRAILLALASVPGLWVAGIGLNVISSLIFGYTTAVPPTMYPRSVLEALALALTTVVAAPICEEIIFRGYVQRGYERGGAWAGIVFGGLIFALYHLRFQGVFALIPIALGMGFVVWRTGSIYPAILMHAAFNAIATVVLISTSFLSVQVTGMLAVALACTAIVVAPFSLVALWRLWKGPLPELAPVPPQTRSRNWLWVLPALALLAVYAFAAVTEVLVQRFPETVLDDGLDLTPPEAWEEEVAWTYVVQSRLGRDLGSATCSRLPVDAQYVMECEAGYEGFDIADDLPGLGGQLEGFDWSDLPFNIPGLESAFQAPPRTWTLSANWAQATLELTAFDLESAVSGQPPSSVRFAADGMGRGVTVQPSGEEARILPVEGEPVLMLHEWAWRFGALPFDMPYGGPVTVVEEDAVGGAAVYRGFLRVIGGEPAWTPAGNFIAWHVTVTWEDAAGQRQARSAWYTSESPHTLVRYDDGVVSYFLESIETGP